jgi:hypothetical protein
MQHKPATYCPLLQKDCIRMKCAWYIRVAGTNPQTGQLVDEYGCAMAWMPVLLIENAQQSRQTGAAVESLRNETVKANENGNKVLLDMLRGGAPMRIGPR